MTNRLREVVEERLISQQELATLTGLPYSTVRRLASDQANVPLHVAWLITDVLDLEIEELFSLEPPQG